MASEAFASSLPFILRWEGGYVNHPADPGGETKYGISKRSYPHLDIASLTLTDAKEIYWRDYWAKAGCDLCDPGLALVVFDAAVNNGVRQAVRWLQQAVVVASDGVIGPLTQAAIAAAKGQAGVAAMQEMHAQRIDTMARLPGWSSFGTGWSRRLARLPYQAAVVAASFGTLEG